MTFVDDDETEKTAFMSMVVVQQPVAKKNFRIMTSQNNISVLGDYCIRYRIQKSVGEDDGESIFDSMCIPEQIPRMYSPKSSVTMDCLLPKHGTGLIEALTVSMIPEQQDMEIESDDKTSIQVPTNTYEPSIP